MAPRLYYFSRPLCRQHLPSLKRDLLATTTPPARYATRTAPHFLMRGRRWHDAACRRMRDAHERGHRTFLRNAPGIRQPCAVCGLDGRVRGTHGTHTSHLPLRAQPRARVTVAGNCNKHPPCRAAGRLYALRLGQPATLHASSSQHGCPVCLSSLVWAVFCLTPTQGREDS